MKNRLLLLAVTLFLAAPGLLRADGDGGALRRLSAEFQNSTSLSGTGDDKILTNAAALPDGKGGAVFYDETVKLPDDVDVIYVTFSGQGDAHNGSALLMTATVNDHLIEPLAGQSGFGGGGPHLQTGWYTLIHSSQSNAANCNERGGGTGDCHDTSLYFSGCYRLSAAEKKKHDDDESAPKFARIKIALADLPGGDGNAAFIERSTIYIDRQKDKHGTACRGAGSLSH
jgi:hypothetical protein